MNKFLIFLFLFVGFIPLNPAEGETETAACTKTYENIFADNELNVVVAFGYKDARPFRFVADRYEKSFFAERMLKPCTDELYACGFTRAKSDQELFEKTVTMPFGEKEKKVTIKVRLITSSAGPDDEENRINPYQRWVSQRAETVFTEGIKSADIVLYSGHSRAGGGPDFRPPVLLKNDHVAYGLYKKKQPGLKMITDTLENSKTASVQLLGLFSCASSQLFVAAVQSKKPNIGVVSSTSLIYHADALQNMHMTLDSLIAKRCGREFAEKIRSNDSRSGSKIIGFF